MFNPDPEQEVRKHIANMFQKQRDILESLNEESTDKELDFACILLDSWDKRIIALARTASESIQNLAGIARMHTMSLHIDVMTKFHRKFKERRNEQRDPEFPPPDKAA
jgi:hypothetical protein